jgi:DNA-binding protein YbaB
MKKYIQELEDNAEKAILNNFREDYHYSFVEYQGSNLTHWSFDPDDEDIKKIKSNYVCANSFLIADGDVATKGNRKRIYEEMLGEKKFFPLDVKEIENLIPVEVLKKLVKTNFNRYGGDINSIKYEDYAEKGIEVGLGKYLEEFLLLKPLKTPKKSKKLQSNTEKLENEINEAIVVYKADSGTIKSKVNFCEKAIKIMEDPNFSWELTDKLEELCKAIFEHIKSQNITK